MLKKKIKPNFKVLGPKYGGKMKEIAKVVNQLTMDDVVNYEQNKHLNLIINNENICFEEEAFDVITEDVPGWKIATNEHITVALDLQISTVLKNEGIARDLGKSRSKY